jgi:hypothetical protein
MAWASTNVTPATNNLTFQLSQAALTYNSLSQVFIPTAQGGGAFNCAAMTSAQLNMDNGLTPGAPGYANLPLTNTLGAVTATSFALSCAPSEIETILGSFLTSSGSTRGNYSIVGSDGTTGIVIARGTWNLQVGP